MRTARTTGHIDASLIVTHFVEDLNPVTVAVTYVDQTVISYNHAVHYVYKDPTHSRVDLRRRSLAPPLAEELAFFVEDSDTFIAVAIGDIKVAIRGIDRDVRWAGETRMTRVQWLRGRAFSRVRAVDGIELAFGPYLQQQFAVMSIFLNYSVAGTGSPKVSLFIEEATVELIRQSSAIPP